jgi:hypothetical protein
LSFQPMRSPPQPNARGLSFWLIVAALFAGAWTLWVAVAW